MNEALFKENVKLLRKYSVKMKNAADDHDELLRQLKEISEGGKATLYENYKNKTGPVNDIRRKVAESLLDRSLEVAQLAHIVETAQENNTKSFRTMYKDWYSLFYVFLIQDFRAEVMKALKDIAAAIIAELSADKKIKAKIFDFTGARSTGSTRCWMAIINHLHDSQTTAKQLFLDVNHGGFEYCFYDRPAERQEDKVLLKIDEELEPGHLIEVFKKHLPEILNDKPAAGPLKRIALNLDARIYKISMGPDSINEDVFETFLNAGLVLVHGDTLAMGGSKVSQGEVFKTEINEGDYFYLCRGNKEFILIGQFNGPAEDCEDDNLAESGWKQRAFTELHQAATNRKYVGEKKWWAPNFNSTCVLIPGSEISTANELIFKPYFHTEFLERKAGSSSTKKIATMNLPLNQILFGPPGTGKTYRTIDLALHIVGADVVGKNRTEIKQIYDEYVLNGQIVFTTFHQSMRYEDFIEGIKPEVVEERVTYPVKPGIFKEICTMAETPDQVNFEKAYQEMVEEVLAMERLELQTPAGGKNFAISVNSLHNFNLHTGKGLKVQGSLTKENIQRAINGEDAFPGWEGYAKGVIAWLKKKYNYNPEKVETQKNYVLIVDEINRGNVSEIFGELITLIEEDKRHGRKEALTVKLPYSKQAFGVPDNLYLIGTMNTADRSVEALDTALRRRFSFVEMEPRPELLAPGYRYWKLLWDYKDVDWKDPEFVEKEKALLDFSGAEQALWIKRKGLWDRMESEGMLIAQVAIFDQFVFTGIDLKEILRTMNRRIEKLLDKDHLIGHSFLIQVDSEDKLKHVFQHKIIPLLQEYFYSDFGKIGLILGKGFVKEKPGVDDDAVFADFDYETSAFDGKTDYELIDYTLGNTLYTFREALALLIKSN
jgi:hypothetical protein